MATKLKRPKKKVCLFLVEGETDQTVLAESLEALYDYAGSETLVRFCRMEDDRRIGGDITSRRGVSPDTVDMLIEKLFVLPFLRKNHLYAKDIIRVVQIADLDGAFIPDANIVKQSSGDPECGVRYENGIIIARDVESIIARNERKRDNLNYLASKQTIKVESKTIPYQIFFFSSNLDHYLFNDANLGVREKMSKAIDYCAQCSGNISYFYKSVLQDSEYCECGYEESWSRIKEGTCSLDRHSNFGIFLNNVGDR